MKTKLAIAFLTFASCRLVHGQSDDIRPMIFVKSAGGESTVDSPITSTTPALQIRAAKDDSKAFIKFGKSLDADYINAQTESFSVFTTTVSAPLNENGPTTSLGSFEGFSNDFTAELKLTRFFIRTRDEGPPKAQLFTQLKSMSTLEASKEAAKQWDTAKWQHVAGLSGTIGYNEYEYIRGPGIDDGKAKRMPYGLKAYWAVMPANQESLFTIGYEYQKRYKDQDDKSIVQPLSANGIQEVKTGPLGPPAVDNKDLVFVEYRFYANKKRSVGVTIRGTYDIDTRKSGVRVPILMVRDDDGKLTGGLELGWLEKDNKFTLGVIVGAAFSVTPSTMRLSR